MTASRAIGKYHVPREDPIETRIVQRHGDCLGVTIPHAEVVAYDIRKGDEVGVRIGDQDPQRRRVQPHGNSLGVYLPVEQARACAVEKGDAVGVQVCDDGCVEVVVDVEE